MTTRKLEIGTARARPGEIVYGAFDALTLPTGGSEFFPVIIAQGRRDGPVLWLTASIHGDEYTGIQVIHQVITQELVANLRGTVVAVPTLNPAGLRTGERTAYYLRKQDPNRLFPAPFAKLTGRELLPPLELAYARLFDQISGTANYLIDLHNYSLGSIPFAFRDPVYYHDDRDRGSAQKLWETVSAMLKAFGLTVVNEFSSPEYLKKNLHRSVSGAALHVAGIPSFTAELGGYLTVNPVIVEAAARGIRNVMIWAGMLGGSPEVIEGVPIIAPGYPIRRTQHPHAPTGGIARFLVTPGSTIRKGDVLARFSDIYGRPVGPDGGAVRSEYDGFVLGITQGTAFYQHDVLMSLAVRDDAAPVLPYPT